MRCRVKERVAKCLYMYFFGADANIPCDLQSDTTQVHRRAVKGLAHGANSGSLAALESEPAIFQPLAP